MKVIITPIGTSLITNYIDEFKAENDNREVNEDIKSIYNDIRNKENIEESDLEDIKGDLKEYLENYSNSCAERTSIDKIKENLIKDCITNIENNLNDYSKKCIDSSTSHYLDIVNTNIIKQELKKDIKIIFIASDTKISKFLAEIFREFYSNSEIESIVGLQTEDKDKFEKEGLKNFIEFFKSLKSKELIFNITAGYKAFIPYLTIIGQLYNIPIKYIFEDSDKLISIPQLPIGFDEKFADLYLPYLLKDNLQLLKLSENLEVKNKLLKDKLIEINENKITLTFIGRFVRDELNYKGTYFGIIIEYLIQNLFIKQNKLPKKGKKYSYIENGREKTGEIDLVIETERDIKYFEIKSISKYKEKQINRHIKEFVSKENTSKKKTLILLLYILNKSLLSKKKQAFQRISNIAKEYNIDFEGIILILKLNI